VKVSALKCPTSTVTQRTLHIRRCKGGKDRYVPMPALTLEAMRRFWTTHRHPGSVPQLPAGSPIHRADRQ